MLYLALNNARFYVFFLEIFAPHSEMNMCYFVYVRLDIVVVLYILPYYSYYAVDNIWRSTYTVMFNYISDSFIFKAVVYYPPYVFE